MQQTVETRESAEFYQLVRLLERYLTADSDGRLPSVGRNATDEDPLIRFRADTAGHARSSSVRPPARMPDARHDPPAEVTTSFLSLLGATGVLPHDYTVLILERVRAGDTAMRDYLNVFHQRVTELAYQVWERSRPEIAWERIKSTQLQRSDPASQQDSFTEMLLSLIGRPDRHTDEQELQARQYYSACYSNTRRPVLALEAMLAESFQVPVCVRQFHPRKVLLQQEEQTRLPARPQPGNGQPRLGHGAIMGSRISIIQTRLLIRLGPLDYHQFCDFLPNGRSYQPLRNLIRSFVGLECELEVELHPDPRQTPELRLGHRGQSSRMGWNSWLGGRRQDTVAPARYVVRD